MLWGASSHVLEVRAAGDGSHVLTGAFQYAASAVLSKGHRERFESRAFSARVDDLSEDIHLLAQHDFSRSLASRKAGTLSVTDGEDALKFEARVTQEIAETSHGRDALAMIRAGLASGLSPGFMVADGGETVSRDRDGVMRSITRALLHEISVVTRPAYPTAQVEARSWVSMAGNHPARRHGVLRWR